MISFSIKERKELFDGRMVSAILPYEKLDSHIEEIQEGNGRLSISGAQEKYALVEYHGELRLTKKGESGRYILKPIPSERRFYDVRDLPANEYLSMNIASYVYKIHVAPHGLCQFQNGEYAYLTRRFDYAADGNKYQMEDFASIAGLSKETSGEDFKYRVLSYEDCADLIKRYCLASKVELLYFYRLIIFNYLISNGDAHLKNFSLISYNNKEYRLSPAYDLLNTGIHIPGPIFALDKGLFKDGTPILDTTPIGRPMLSEFGKRIGLNDSIIEQELDFFAREDTAVWEMIDSSYLSEKTKQSYKNDYKYRLSTLQR